MPTTLGILIAVNVWAPVEDWLVVVEVVTPLAVEGFGARVIVEEAGRRVTDPEEPGICTLTIGLTTDVLVPDTGIPTNPVKSCVQELIFNLPISCIHNAKRKGL